MSYYNRPKPSPNTVYVQAKNGRVDFTDFYNPSAQMGRAHRTKDLAAMQRKNNPVVAAPVTNKYDLIGVAEPKQKTRSFWSLLLGHKE